MEDTKRNAIVEAGAQLKHDVDAHWTKGGQPDCNALSELAGAKVTRAECEEALGAYFNREAAAMFKPDEPGAQVKVEPDQAEGQPTDEAQAQGNTPEGGDAPDDTKSQTPEGTQDPEPANAEDRPRGGGVKMGWVA